jgi:REP element-mobilizing transposase RayT
VIIGDVAAEVGAEVIEVEVMPDHVHLLAEVPPTVPLSRFVGLAKGRSSRLLRMGSPACGGCRCCGARRGLCPRSAERLWRSSVDT